MRAGAGVRSAAVVVGREAELEHLRSALDAAARGAASCTVLVGEGGVGKSRLLTEAVTAARRDRLNVLAGRAPFSTPLPFSVIAEALRSWLRGHSIAATRSPFDSGLRLLLPEWDAPPEQSLGLSPPQLRLLALEGVVRLLKQIAQRGRGALLVFDDLHGADPDSLEVVRYVSAAAIGGLAIVCALRPEESDSGDQFIQFARGDPAIAVLELDPLRPRAVGDLVANLLDSAPPDDLVAAVLARTDGVPLLVEEVVDAYVRAGSLDTASGQAHWRGHAAVVPRSIRGMVESRLERVPNHLRSVLVAGAVLGQFEPARLLASVADAPTAAVAEAIQRGVDSGLLLTRSGTIGFRHDVIAEAVVDSTVPHVIHGMYRRAAAALGPGADDARRGAYLAAAGEYDEAAEVLASAALVELQAHALLSAERLARQARELARAARIHARAADALASVLCAEGRWTEALTLDTATEAEVGETAERRQRMVLSALEAGDSDVAQRVLAGRDDGQPRTRILAARVALVHGDAARAVIDVESALTEDLDLDTRLSALDVKARALDFLGQRVAAEETWTLQAREAAGGGRTQAQLRAIFQLGKQDFFEGRSLDRLRQAVDMARRAGALVELAWAEETLGIGLTLHGSPGAALEVLDDAIARARELRLDQLGFLLAARAGALSFVRESVDDIFAEAEMVAPIPEVRMMSVSVRASIATQHGRFRQALELLKEVESLMATMPGVAPMDSPCELVWVYAALGQLNEARVALNRAESIPDLDRWYMRSVLVNAARALLNADSSGVDAAIAAARGPMPFTIATMRIIGAQVLGGEQHVGWLREALDIYESTGATAYRDRARRLLREAGGAVPRRRAPGEAVPDELARQGVTAREAEVLRLLGEGLSNADIAAKLFVSARTVETHVSSLLGKLNARNRGQLIALHASLSSGG